MCVKASAQGAGDKRAAMGRGGRADSRGVTGARSQDFLLIGNMAGARLKLSLGMLSENTLVLTHGNMPRAWSEGLSAVLC